MATRPEYPARRKTSVDTELRFVPLPIGRRDPVLYTITTAAAGTSVTDVTIASGSSVGVGDTTITVNALSGNIPNKAKILFNNGVTVRLTAAATASATSLNVEAVEGFDPDAPLDTTVIPPGTVGVYRAGSLTAGTEYLSVTPTTVALWAGEKLTFTGGIQVVVTKDAPQGVVTLDVAPTPSLLTSGNIAVTMATYYIAGATDASPNSSPKAVETTNFNSGAGTEQVITGISRTMSFTFQNIQGDPGAEVIKQILYNDDYYNREIYAILKRADGETYEGAAIPTTGSQQSPVQELITIQADLQFQGATFSYTPDAKAPTVF